MISSSIGNYNRRVVHLVLSLLQKSSTFSTKSTAEELWGRSAPDTGQIAPIPPSASSDPFGLGQSTLGIASVPRRTYDGSHALLNIYTTSNTGVPISREFLRVCGPARLPGWSKTTTEKWISYLFARSS